MDAVSRLLEDILTTSLPLKVHNHVCDNYLEKQPLYDYKFSPNKKKRGVHVCLAPNNSSRVSNWSFLLNVNDPLLKKICVVLFLALFLVSLIYLFTEKSGGPKPPPSPSLRSPRGEQSTPHYCRRPA